VAARAAGVGALDTPYFAFRDQEGLRKDALTAKRLGFTGKFAIHPAQIDVINDAFSPSESDIEYARRVVAAFEEAERAGSGSTSLEAKAIDAPVVKRARNLLEVADSFQRSADPGE
jgi:citrate lyase subunit beta/citryl-CoA lyase